MREILFRGFCEHTKSWIIGNYVKAELLTVKSEYEHFIIEIASDGAEFKVLPETVGQYTGLKDKNGNKVFENDIFICGDENIKYRVVYTEDCSFMGQQMNSINGKDTGCRIGLNYWKDKIEIIGNIHDKD